MLTKIFIYFSILYQRVFKGKHYSCLEISQTYLIVDQLYDRVIRDYYKYVLSLLIKALITKHSPRLVLLDCSGFSWLKIFLPIKKVVFQIEHTLVKQGARDCEGALPGHIPIADGSGTYLVRLANPSRLQNADVVIEYSLINQFNIQKNSQLASYAVKAFCISPTIYSLHEESLIASSKRQLSTITLFGNPNEPRRKEFLNRLASLGVESQNINNVYDDVENLYRNTKILINIRQTDHHDTFEELRVLPALQCGVIVISERAPLIEKTYYSKYILWGELDELPALALDVQQNYDFWHQKIFRNPGFIRRMHRISKRNKLVSLRAVQFLNTL
jgi:hypothetical protein